MLDAAFHRSYRGHWRLPKVLAHARVARQRLLLSFPSRWMTWQTSFFKRRKLRMLLVEFRAAVQLDLFFRHVRHLAFHLYYLLFLNLFPDPHLSHLFLRYLRR